LPKSAKKSHPPRWLAVTQHDFQQPVRAGRVSASALSVWFAAFVRRKVPKDCKMQAHVPARRLKHHHRCHSE
ncbi:hypothetical protein, partial [Sinorhizobium saheli]|uniref:hypothetical protein n=1 Tax=Sinorhizobium saheli TaxID=36856 RepID=UPI001AEC8701